jgi:hypothetical protein
MAPMGRMTARRCLSRPEKGANMGGFVLILNFEIMRGELFATLIMGNLTKQILQACRRRPGQRLLQCVS